MQTAIKKLCFDSEIEVDEIDLGLLRVGHHCGYEKKEVIRSRIDEIEETNSVQWSTQNGKVFFPCHKTTKKLPSDVYNIIISNGQLAFVRDKFDTEDLIRFEDSLVNEIVKDIQNFWTKKSVFEESSITFKRGILLTGPAGSGKTCTIKLLVEDIIKRGGIAINFDDNFVVGVKTLREIQPETPLVVILEDIEVIMGGLRKSYILNVLDGITRIEGVVYVATTNYPEELEGRIINRPSRFDRRYIINTPSEGARYQYIEFLRKKIKKEVDVTKWVNDTKDLSVSHIKELFVSVYLLDSDYDQTLKELREMSKQISSETFSKKGGAGFAFDD